MHRLLFTALALILMTTSCSSAVALEVTPPTKAPAPPPREKVTLGADKEVFKLDLALDGPARAKGLMEVKSIKKDGGMIFVYPNARVRTMWMANCLCDMDVIFLDGTGRVLKTYTMKAEPARGENETQWVYENRLKRYSSVRRAQFAIELKAGSVKRLKIEAGQRIALDLKSLRKRAR